MSRAELLPCKSASMSGTRSAARMRTFRSRGLAVPLETRASMRSMSPMPVMARMSSARRMLSDTSSCTAAWRRPISAAESSGRSTQVRSSRPPMGVLVKSSMPSRLPDFSPLRIVSVISRLRRVA